MVQGVGTFESLRDSGLDFAKLLPKNEEVVEDEKTLNRSISRTSKDSRQSFNRQSSVSSFHSQVSDDLSDHIEHVMEEEKRSEGSIGLTYYKSYFGAAGGYFITIIVIFFFILAQGCASLSDYFLSYWVVKEERRSLEQEVAPSNVSETIRNISQSDEGIVEKAARILEEVVYDRNYDIYIFSALTIGTILITLTRSFMFFNVAMKASRQLHDGELLKETFQCKINEQINVSAMFSGITRATMNFFNTNPSGRVLNRFSKDIGQIDEILPSIMIDVLQIFLALAGIVAVVGIVNPYSLIPTVIIAIMFYFMRSFYLLSSRNIKRMEATS